MKLSLAAAAMLAMLSCPMVMAQVPTKLTVDETSREACRAYASTKGTGEHGQDFRYCMFLEFQAASALSRLAGVIPDQLVGACNRAAVDSGSDYERKSYARMLDCFNRYLSKAPPSDLPSGWASLTANGVETRYWTAEECQSNRGQGQVCVIH